MTVINEKYDTKSVQSVRINDKLLEICKETGFNTSTIIESSLLHFCRLTDEEKIKFLVENDLDKVDSESLIAPKYNYAELAITEAKQNLGKQAVGLTTKLLVAFGLVLLLAFFFSKKED